MGKATLQIEGDVSFIRNSASLRGGAVYVRDSPNVTVDGTLFVENSSNFSGGGGVFVEVNTIPTLESSGVLF